MIPRTTFRLGGPRSTTNTANSLRNLIHYFSSSAASAPAPRSPQSKEESIVYRQSRKFARPTTVKWSNRLDNCVKLIGTVEYLPKKCDSDDKVGCHTILLVKPSSNSRHHFRVTLNMWDSLAEQALAYLKPNDYIYVSGQWRSYTKEGAERLYYQGVIGIPESYFKQKELLYAIVIGNSGIYHSDVAIKGGNHTNASICGCFILFSAELDDNRTEKVTVKELNYVRLPNETYQVAAKPKSESEADESPEDKKRKRHLLFQLMFANPYEWYDNRKTKKSPRHPDFSHKSTDEALWLSNDDPPWLRRQVELLDSRLSERSSDDDVSFGSWVSDDW